MRDPLPFLRLIITLLLRGKMPEFIHDKLKDFGFAATVPEIQSVYEDLRATASKSILEVLEAHEPIDITKQGNKEYCEMLGVLEYIDYIEFRHQNEGRRIDEHKYGKNPHYKWFDDIHWILRFPDIASLIETFMFNDEDHAEISAVVGFKYKKKLSAEALERFQNIFWDTSSCTAKDAIMRCSHFKDNTLVIKTLSTGEQDASIFQNYHKSNGSSVNVVFHPVEYIKWKIGYKKLTPPKPKDFIEAVQTDSYHKYYEAMNMETFAEWSKEESVGGEFGDTEATKISYKNVEEQKAKLAKHWFEMYLKAHSAMPDEGESDGSFFDKLDQYALAFDDEKIANARDVDGLIDDVKGDLH